MDNNAESIDQALEAFSRELTAARLPRENPKLESIQSRIKALKKAVDSPDAVEEIRNVRADLLAYLRKLEAAVPEAAPEETKLSKEQQELIQRRIEACLEYALSQSENVKKPPPGGLAWLARLRV